MDKNLMDALQTVCLSGNAAAIVTIIKTKGSTPRKSGTKMIVTQDGFVFGTIGGGCGEADVRREALYALDHLKPVKYVVTMNQDLAADEGMVCGGTMEVLIDILPPGQNDKKKFMLEYVDALMSNAPTMLTVIDNTPAPWITVSGQAFVTPAGSEVRFIKDNTIEQKFNTWLRPLSNSSQISLEQDGQYELLIEPAATNVELIILGGGHIALPLSAIARILGYHVTVVDDRPLYASQARFSEVDRVICNDFKQAIHSLEITDKSYVVIVTRGHRHDKLCLKAIIDMPTAYIGMIGSKRRVKALIAELIDEGISSEALTGVHMPIGVAIGAQTPEEIAVSIIAEIIQVHRSRNTLHVAKVIRYEKN